MPDNKSPWGNGNGGKPQGGKPTGGKSPWGQGGRPDRGRPGSGETSPDLENVIEGFKNRMRGGGGGGRGPRPETPLGKLGPLGIFLVVGVVMLLMSSIYKIDQNEEGVILRFGQYSRTTEPGLHFKFPSPIETKEVIDVDSERTITIGGGGRENLMLTGDENIARVAYAVIWRVKNSADYVFNLQDVPGAVSDVAESAMREVVGKTELEALITDQRDQVAANVQQLMQQMLDEYKAGVVVSQVELKESQEPKQVEAAFLDVVSAKQDAEQAILKARETENVLIPAANAEADKLIQEALGYKEAVIAESKGDADRFRSIYKEYKLAPQVTRQRMYLETIEEVYSDKEKIILDDAAGSGVVPYLPLDQLNKKKP